LRERIEVIYQEAVRTAGGNASEEVDSTPFCRWHAKALSIAYVFTLTPARIVHPSGFASLFFYASAIL
jgi:hypothetical protein